MQVHASAGVPTLFDAFWFSEVGRFFDWESATRHWACTFAAPGLSNSNNTAVLAQQPRTLTPLSRGGSYQASSRELTRAHASSHSHGVRAKKSSSLSCQEERACVDSRTALLAQLLLRPSADIAAWREGR